MRPRLAIAGALIGTAGWAFAGGIIFGTAETPTYGHDHQLIAQTIAANDSMAATCRGGWAGLELKADGTSEIIGHCPPGTPLAHLSTHNRPDGRCHEDDPCWKARRP